MDIIIHPKKLNGSIRAISSKSHAHRLLICAAFSDQNTQIKCRSTGEDINATAICLAALGAGIQQNDWGFSVTPITEYPSFVRLNVGQSATTLRFLLPIVGALGIDAEFIMEGRLPDRPLSPLWEEMERMGCRLSRPTSHTLRCSGKLKPGMYQLAGNVSSQFVSGLLLAFPLMSGRSDLKILGNLESRPYVDLTLQVLQNFGISCKDGSTASGKYISPGELTVEGDWSSAAFFIGAKALGSHLSISGLSDLSLQADSAVGRLIQVLKEHAQIDVSNTPDLVPVLCVVAACCSGAAFINIHRLRTKESDRVSAICAMLRALGCHAKADDDMLVVHPGTFHGATIESCGDHRIAMAAAIAATVASGDVTITNAQCVSKSYPSFWEDYRKLGGDYEQSFR